MKNINRRLRGKIVEVFGTTQKFAEALGKSRVSVSNKLNGVTQMTRDDIASWARALEIKDEDILHYFF